MSLSMKYDLLEELFGDKIPLLPLVHSENLGVAWLKGLWFESAFFESDPSPLTPCSIDIDIMGARSKSLYDLMISHNFFTETFEWIVSKVNRLVFSGMQFQRPDEDMYQLVDKVFTKETAVQQELGVFGKSDPVTPSLWYRRMLDQIPPEERPAVPTIVVNHIFKLLAVFGVLANIKPSQVAAGMLVVLLGERAQPYLCGYDASDLDRPVEVLTYLLDCYSPNWQTTF